MPRAEMRALQGGDVSENAAITRSILSGATGPTRDVVVLNAAAALLVAERVRTLRDGIVLAAEAIDSGGASRKLDQLVEVSNRRMEANPA